MEETKLQNYKKVQIKRFPKTVKTSAESRYWQSFKSPVDRKEVAKITDIEFNPTAPDQFAVTSSTRVQVYDAATVEVKKKLSRFTDVAYSGHWRKDGRLMVAGGETSYVQVFDMDTRNILRSFRVHSAAVHVTRFSADMQHILSGSDDKTLRRLDMHSQKETACFTGHTDHVRCAIESPSSTTTWFSGGYDHVVKMWDTRSKPSEACALNLDHGHPVDALLSLPGGGLIVSAGSNELKVWDILAGGKLVHTFSGHQKNVTCLALDSSASRLLSGSLDHTVKIWDLASYKVTHSLKYKSPVLSLAISAHNTCLAVGMTDGTLSVRRRLQQLETPEVRMSNIERSVGLTAAQLGVSAPLSGSGHIGFAPGDRKIHTGTQRYFLRGAQHTPSIDDYAADKEHKQRLKPYDQFLKKFQYHNALDAALETKRAPVIVSVIDELSQRAGLRIALSNRDEQTLEPVLSFLVKQISNPRYSALLIDVANILLDMYSSVLGQSIGIDEQFMKLKDEVEQETQLHKSLLQLLGSISLIVSANNAAAEAASALQTGSGAGSGAGSGGAGAGSGSSSGVGAGAGSSSAVSAAVAAAERKAPASAKLSAASGGNDSEDEGAGDDDDSAAPTAPAAAVASAAKQKSQPQPSQQQGTKRKQSSDVAASAKPAEGLAPEPKNKKRKT